MALIARLQHPYIVEFKEAWVEKVFICNPFYIFLINFLHGYFQILFYILFRDAMFALSQDTVKAEICEFFFQTSVVVFFNVI